MSVACGRALAQEPPESTPLLVLISIDGLHPEHVTAAETHGAKVPNLRRFLKEGTYASGVTGVVPTLTYPSHTTQITGVAPAKHGIFSNEVFDPTRINGWNGYWYAEAIRVETLWDIAVRSGRTTASLDWPVSVGSPSITWNIPQARDPAMVREVSTPGLLDELAEAFGASAEAKRLAPEVDALRARYAEWILENKRPALMTLHLDAMDWSQHVTGPFSLSSTAVLERIDTIVGRLRATAERVAPDRAYLAIVSDHGMAAYDKRLNLLPAFKEAGLFTSDTAGAITNWEALPWPAGGSAAIVLRNPHDTATRARVRSLLDGLAKDPENGIDRIHDGGAHERRGGFPEAAFVVGLRAGWSIGQSLDEPVLTHLNTPGGAHGYFPDLPEMTAAFFLIGPRVPAGLDLGVIDMWDIAPTLAALIGLDLPDTDGKNLLP